MDFQDPAAESLVATDLAEQIDEIVDSTPTVVEFDPDDGTAQNLINDCATKLHPYTTVARRYGLTMPQLYDFIAQPEVRRRIKQRRAIWDSDDNIQERNRKYYGTISMEAAPVLDGILHDPVAPASAKLEAFKIAGKFAGLESSPRQTEGNTGPTAAQFNVQIVFSGGQVERISASPAPPQIEGEAA